MTLPGPDSTKLAEQFEEKWSDDEFPDVDEFLEDFPPANINERVEVLIVDQRNRWRRGVGRFVEEYVRLCGDAENDCYLKLKFIAEEFNALEELGQHPEITDFLSRFPDIDEHLIREVLSCANQDERRARLLSTMGSDLLDSVGSAPVDQTLAEPLENKPTVSIQIGEDIGRYSVSSLLGAGAYGRVYAAVDTELHRTIAIKVPNPRRFRKKQDAAQYLSEARVVARLDLPISFPSTMLVKPKRACALPSRN